MKNFRLNLIIRIALLTLSITVFFYVYYKVDLLATLLIIGCVILYQVVSLIRYIDVTNKELARFLQSIKYSDFSQTFSKKQLGSSFRELNNEFNDVIMQFQKTRSEKEENFRFVQTVMQHVGIGLITFNQEGKVEFINNAAKKIFRVNYLYHIGAVDTLQAGLSEILLKLRPGEKSTIRITSENESLQLMVYASEFKLRNQKYTLLSFQNILPELEEQEMDAWQKLIRVLTHEIMNSVTPISSLASTVNNILATGNLNDEETINDVKIAVETIRKRSEGLIHFVDDYRSLTRIPEPHFEIFLVKDLLHRVRKLMEREMSDKNIKLLADVHPPYLELTADPELIEQVLINLLLNSIYFVSEITDPEIRMSAYLDEWGRVSIKVIDNGAGINEDMLDKIFIPFFSTKKKGSGIGLSLSRQIIRSHGGAIRVTSKPFLETTFILRF